MRNGPELFPGSELVPIYLLNARTNGPTAFTDGEPVALRARGTIDYRV